jgi:hypothetical protein
MCNPPLPGCFLNNCEYYPGLETLRQFFKDTLEANIFDQITYKNWLTVDRTSLETVIESTDEFIESLFVNVDQLKRHFYCNTTV